MWELEGRLRMCTFSVFPSVFLAPLKLPKADFTFLPPISLWALIAVAGAGAKKNPKRVFLPSLRGRECCSCLFPFGFFAPEFRDSSFVGARKKMGRTNGELALAKWIRGADALPHTLPRKNPPIHRENEKKQRQQLQRKSRAAKKLP